jgi:hypothetical protein
MAGQQRATVALACSDLTSCEQIEDDTCDSRSLWQSRHCRKERATVALACSDLTSCEHMKEDTCDSRDLLQSRHCRK